MLYNTSGKNSHLETAGKITILTAVTGLLVFLFVFIFNAGKVELMKAVAAGNTATTTLTVLNIPPAWTDPAIEEFESSAANPTNSESDVSWIATATKSNGNPYFMIICDGNGGVSATPTPHAAPNINSMGTVPPTCAPGEKMWGVATASSGAEVRVSTTTEEVWAESNNWFAWICDDDYINPRCNDTFSQGSGTGTSPFVVNHRPLFTAAMTANAADPGGVITFISTSTDPDTLRVPNGDALTLIVCAEDQYDVYTRDCTNGSLASTTGLVYADASAAFTVPIPTQDSAYDAYVFLIDQFGHTAVYDPSFTTSKHRQNVGFTVNNVAPTVSTNITINGGSNILLTNAGTTTPGFTLQFETSDANSCVNTASTSEVTDVIVALHRSSIATTTCDGTPGVFNSNNCYTSGGGSNVGLPTWDLVCTPNIASCGGVSDVSMEWNCTFPMWYNADPTDGGSPWAAEDWVASIAGIDDNNATGTLFTSATPQTLTSLLALDLQDTQIPYGALEPGQNTGTLRASTTILSIGNTGLNEHLQGEAMCLNFDINDPTDPCGDNDPTKTVPVEKQQFAITETAYDDPSNKELSSSTVTLLEIESNKTINPLAPTQGKTFWGIEVPSAIAVSGDYSGLNTFSAVTSPSGTW